MIWAGTTWRSGFLINGQRVQRDWMNLADYDENSFLAFDEDNYGQGI